ncbi:type 1 glutamine amidotransferase domain-containing protein [Parasphingopyxis marina]|uniref:Type 1 glutamine amidotransferase n=1 Tax=Parasphingopyxis marina TaxID=2761622 RepID=A0A842HZ21_9SPHN|nr:type 1 glutamine amidotransferase domain-containing protein [Parasphingopyxis marina]MBC2778426.1 type 1 glutamine amidotransferase [Parasphingopyxis marina]
MTTPIGQAKILMLATDGFEYSELTEPRSRLETRGADVWLASPDTKPITGESGGTPKGEPIRPDMTLDAVDPSDYDALLLPGGQRNPDSLRIEDRAIAIIRAFGEAGKPIAAICHAPWLLIEAGLVEGKAVTGWPSVRTDLRNAGGTVRDEEVVVDGNIITSRKPDDIPAFTDALIAAIEDRDGERKAA